MAGNHMYHGLGLAWNYSDKLRNALQFLTEKPILQFQHFEIRGLILQYLDELYLKGASPGPPSGRPGPGSGRQEGRRRVAAENRV